MKYLSLITLLIASTSLYPSHLVPVKTKPVVASKVIKQEEAQELTDLFKKISQEERKLLSEVIENIIFEQSIKEATEKSRTFKENKYDLMNAIMTLSAIKNRIQDNNFQPLIDIYEILLPGESQTLQARVNKHFAIDPKDTPKAFIRRVAHKDAYSILGVKKDGLTPEMIKEAFRKLALEVHRDKNPAYPESSEAAFKMISDARDKLLKELDKASAASAKK